MLRFGPYETLFRIASGGMAEVFAARAPDDGSGEQLRAVKRIAPHLAEDRAFVAMFLDEGRLASQVSSPHVVRTYELGQADDGSLYLAMELVIGITWAELVTDALGRRRPLPPAIVIEMAAQAADGLHDAHEARTAEGEPLELVHRDVSPQNLLIGIDGVVRVTDFGIARARIARYAHTTRGQRKGKLAYFSPEQSRGEPLDRRSDIFSLAVVTWETLAGRRLFGGTSYAEVIEQLRRAHVPDLTAIRPDVPPGVASIIAGALAASREDRPPTAAKFARALRDAAREAGIDAGAPEVAAFLARAEVPRLAKLCALLREAIESHSVRTRIDLSAASTYARMRFVDAGEGADPEATLLLAPDEETVATAVPELPTRLFRDTEVVRAPRRFVRTRTLALAAALGFALLATVLACAWATST
ncbi:MAG TPA: serine/threonine-protein kinase [Sandaracinaceae bacterium]